MPLSIQLILLSLICITAFNCSLHGRVKARQLKPGVIKRRVFLFVRFCQIKLFICTKIVHTIFYIDFLLVSFLILYLWCGSIG
jgi:hypothetical protein